MFLHFSLSIFDCFDWILLLTMNFASLKNPLNILYHLNLTFVTQQKRLCCEDMTRLTNSLKSWTCDVVAFIFGANLSDDDDDYNDDDKPVGWLAIFRVFILIFAITMIIMIMMMMTYHLQCTRTARMGGISACTRTCIPWWRFFFTHLYLYLLVLFLHKFVFVLLVLRLVFPGGVFSSRICICICIIWRFRTKWIKMLCWRLNKIQNKIVNI